MLQHENGILFESFEQGRSRSPLLTRWKVVPRGSLLVVQNVRREVYDGLQEKNGEEEKIEMVMAKGSE